MKAFSSVAIRSLYQEVVKDNLVKIDSVYTYVSGNAGLGLGGLSCHSGQGRALYIRNPVSVVQGERKLDLQGRFLRQWQFSRGQLVKPSVPATNSAHRSVRSVGAIRAVRIECMLPGQRIAVRFHRDEST